MTGDVPGGNPGRRIPALIVTHGTVAAALLAAAEGIAGPASGVECFSNAGLRPEDLAQALADRLDLLGAPTLLLVDLAGGSTLAAAQRAGRGRAGVHIVAGLNLPLLLDFLQKRDTLPVDALVEHIVDRGRAGLTTVAPPTG